MGERCFKPRVLLRDCTMPTDNESPPRDTGLQPTASDSVPAPSIETSPAAMNAPVEPSNANGDTTSNSATAADPAPNNQNNDKNGRMRPANGDKDGESGDDEPVDNDHGEDASEAEDPASEPELQIHAVRKSKTRAERKKKQGGKAGNPGRFTKEIQAFLDEYVDVYNAISKGKKGRNKDLDDFWHMMQCKVWQKFTVDELRIGMPMDGARLGHQAIVEATNDVRIVTHMHEHLLNCFLSR